jgi:hypothetical protein
MALTLCVPAILRVRGYILLRPTHFQDRDIHHLVNLGQTGAASTTGDNSSSSSSSQFTCWKVPRNLSSKGWPQLVNNHLADVSSSHLVLSADAAVDIVLPVLAKFEDQQYIHVYRPVGEAGLNKNQAAAANSSSSSNAGASQLLFELPRYGLTFQLQQGKLWSLDHAGWYLAPCQQLVNFTPDDMSSKASSDGSNATAEAPAAAASSYTLLGLSQYLVLCKEEPGSSVTSSSVLMPAGLVTRVSPGAGGPGAPSVQLRTSPQCDADLQVSGRTALHLNRQCIGAADCKQFCCRVAS